MRLHAGLVSLVLLVTGAATGSSSGSVQPAHTPDNTARAAVNPRSR